MDPILHAPFLEVLALLLFTGAVVCGAIILWYRGRSGGRKLPRPSDIIARLGRKRSLAF